MTEKFDYKKYGPKSTNIYDRNRPEGVDINIYGEYREPKKKIVYDERRIHYGEDEREIEEEPER